MPDAEYAPRAYNHAIQDVGALVSAGPHAAVQSGLLPKVVPRLLSPPALPAARRPRLFHRKVGDETFEPTRPGSELISPRQAIKSCRKICYCLELFSPVYPGVCSVCAPTLCREVKVSWQISYLVAYIVSVAAPVFLSFVPRHSEETCSCAEILPLGRRWVPCTTLGAKSRWR
jgi:hypothetical protein